MLMGPRGRPAGAGAEDAPRAPGGGLQGRGRAQGERRWRPGREKPWGLGDQYLSMDWFKGKFTGKPHI